MPVISQREADICAAIPGVRGPGLVGEIGLMQRDDFGAVETEPPGKPVDNCREAAGFADDETLSFDPRVITETFKVANLGNGLLARASSGQAFEGGNGLPSDHAVGRHTLIVLEISDGTFRVGSEDAVEPSGIETEAAEPLLEIGDVVASGHRGPQVDHAIAEPIVRIDERGPGLTCADAVLDEAPRGLELAQRLLGVVIEPFRVTGLAKSGRAQASMEIANPRTVVTAAERQAGGL